MEAFDYVIVGGGTAGCMIAARLSAAPGVSVCLLEAGPRDRSPLIHIPAGFFKLVFNSPFTWGFESEPGPNTNGRRIPAPQGRVLGGSSSINGMIYNRGQAADYDVWAQRGNPGWSYSDLLPYFKRSERRIGPGESHFRGVSGALPVTDMPWEHPLSDAFFAAALSLGVPRNPDYNGETQYGVGLCQSNVNARRRMSAARAFLYPALKRGAIDLRTDVHARSIIFEGRRAVGVAFDRGGSSHRVHARREVIVTCGAINSPKFLQLSGIGPADLLQRIGVPVVQHLPGVGENVRDHYGARLVARVRPGVKTINDSARGTRLAWEAVRWLLGRGSVLHLGPIQVYLFGKSRPELDFPDYTIGLTSAMSKLGVPAQLDDNPGLTLGGWQSRPNSAGYVRARSANPQEAPELQLNYLSDETDKRVFVAAMQMSRRLMQTEALGRFVKEEILPGPDVQSEDEWLDFGRSYGGSGFHFVGSCRMGPETELVCSCRLAIARNWYRMSARCGFFRDADNAVG